MLCDFCGKNPATVHLTEIINGKITEIHLCQVCAKKKSEEFQKQFSLADLLGELIDVGSIDVSLPDIKCSYCGLKYQDFKQKGRLGCAHCYENFKSQLLPLLRKIHGSVKHQGKSPKIKTKETLSLKEKIDELKGYLEKAIKLEEYEEAARIRDEIRELEKKLEKENNI